MKPPPRKRGKPNRPTPTEGPRKPPRRWNKTEEKTLLNALQKLGRTALADGDTDNIDYSFLGKRLPKRSVAEVPSVLRLLTEPESEQVTGEKNMILLYLFRTTVFMLKFSDMIYSFFSLHSLRFRS